MVAAQGDVKFKPLSAQAGGLPLETDYTWTILIVGSRTGSFAAAVF